MKILIVIPTYNEVKNLEELIKKIWRISLEMDKNSLNILIIDDNSPDGTAELANELKNDYFIIKDVIKREKKKGLASAYITGFKYAIKNNYDLIFEMDADLSHSPGYIIDFLQEIEKGYDVVIGSRYINGIRVLNWSISRLILSYFAGLYVRFITGMPVKDPTSGFKLFRRNVLERLNLDGMHSKGYSFQVENVFKAYKNNFKIKEIPIIFYERYRGKSKMSRMIAIEAVFRVVLLKIESILKGKKFR